MAAGAAARPHGLVTRVFEGAAAREATFRFLESRHSTAEALAAASERAAARRASGLPFVYVAVDSTSLTLTDTKDAKGFGPLTTKSIASRGLHVMNALALAPDGQAAGICARSWWARGRRRVPRARRDRRPVAARETQHWLTVLDGARRCLARDAPGVRPWFQLDRGADCTPVLTHAIDNRLLITVRAAHNRRLANGHRLRARLAAQPLLATRTVHVPATATTPARDAHLAIRTCSVELRLALGLRAKGPYRTVRVHAVQAREVRPPRGAKRLEWLLLTTYPFRSPHDALNVLRGYTMRWPIESFHRTWKTGLCQVEASQLRSADALKKWATLLAAVAVRAERLKMMSREQPDLPASTEFTQEEIDAVILLREPKGHAIGEVPTLGEVVRWIADYGGYTGKSSGGPPGAIVIGRALPEILAVAKVLAKQRGRSTTSG